MTRRDLQLAAREKGRPWDLGKDFENVAVVSEIAPMPGVVLDRGRIALKVNGEVKQKSDSSKLIWNVARSSPTSRTSIICAGRPDLHRHARGRRPGAARRQAGGKIEGVGTIALTIGPPE